MSDKYRVSVKYDAQRAAYVARAPELSQCAAEGETRAEALGNLEQEIAAQLETIRSQGGAPPVPVDDLAPVHDRHDGDGSPTPDAGGDGAGDAAGQVSAAISPSLHREIMYSARVEGVAVDALVGELLAEALAMRTARELRGAPGARPRRGGDPQRGRRDGQQRSRGRHDYNQIMEDKSSFLEYVRSLEGGGGGPRRQGQGRGRGRGRGGPRGGDTGNQ